MKKAGLGLKWLGLLLALDVGCGSSGGERPEPQVREEVAAVAAADVETVRVEEAEVPRVLHLVGTLKARETSSVAAGVSGKVEAVLVERGFLARKGAPLVRLDARSTSASAEEARAQVEVARIQKEVADAECERSRILLESGSVSVVKHQELAAQCRQAGANLRAAEARLRMLELSVADS
ncbi:MAG TPA: biotin/lipoyl-binding protein, partial [Myxococcaceae bacterium]|nr:biotin/lipoyl-binding protein [Myxococcaceae bacterium]